MYDNILHKPVRLRTNISLSARSVLEGVSYLKLFNLIILIIILVIKLLQKDKKRRIGFVDDAEELKRHEFFKPINWGDLESKNIPPPFNPNVVRLN